MATGLWKTPKPRFGLILHLPVNIYLKNAKYNEISHYQAINIEIPILIK